MTGIKTYAIGIDIGGTRTKIGLVNLLLGQVESMVVTPTETRDGSRFLAHISDAVHQFKEKTARDGTALAGVGIGVPGFVFADGSVDSTYGFLEFMEDYPLSHYVQQQHDLPCRLDNDARVVALGEAMYGQGRGYSRVLTLTLGTGLGLGFTIDGTLDGLLPFGHMGGHITVTTDELMCYCGKRGCLEALVCGAGIGRIADQHAWQRAYPNLPPTAETLFGQRRAGNALAEAIVQQYLGYLRIGIDNYINLYAPDRIVLGGGISKGLRNDTARLHSPQRLYAYKNYQTTFAVSDLEEQAGILGGAALFRLILAEQRP